MSEPVARNILEILSWNISTSSFSNSLRTSKYFVMLLLVRASIIVFSIGVILEVPNLYLEKRNNSRFFMSNHDGEL